MTTGKVEQVLTAEQTAPALEGQRFLMVQIGDSHMAAADLVGAKPGDRVLLACGWAAARLSMDAPVDAAVVGILSADAASGAR